MPYQIRDYLSASGLQVTQAAAVMGHVLTASSSSAILAARRHDLLLAAARTTRQDNVEEHLRKEYVVKLRAQTNP